MGDSWRKVKKSGPVALREEALGGGEVGDAVPDASCERPLGLGWEKLSIDLEG